MNVDKVYILEDRGILYINGDDCTEFLQNLITNDLKNFEIFLLEVFANQFNIKYITTKMTSVIKKKFM